MTSPHSYPPPYQEEPVDPGAQHPLYRFRRSSRDRKLGGVAGGIGRALGVDPVLIRVAFVVLTIFGGSGIGLYALGWLLLPGDHDEASAAEALIGRRRSSVPAPLAIVLCLVVLGSFTSMFTWGLRLLPIAIVATIVFVVLGRRRRRSWRFHDADRFGEHLQQFADRAGRWGDDVSRKAERWGDDFGRRAERWGDDFGRRAERWGDDFGRKAERWGADFGHRMGGGRRSGHGRAPEAERSAAEAGAGSSPFDRPAFWDDGRPAPEAARGAAGNATRGAADSPVDLNKDTSGEPSAAWSAATEQPGQQARPSAPAWDPLGAAPFAWDLPEPGPVPPSPQELASSRRAKALGRATFGLALIVGAALALGLSLHWWDISWAVISASALAVIAVGLFVSAIRGRRSNLIGVGILLSVATAFFTITGFNGTGGFGDHTWAPQSVAEIEADGNAYTLAGGDATLDLRHVKVPAGKSVPIDVNLKVGDLTVLLPDATNVEATCTGNFGSIDCLGDKQDGVHNKSEQRLSGDAKSGTLDLTASIGAGDLEVRAP